MANATWPLLLLLLLLLKILRVDVFLYLWFEWEMSKDLLNEQRKEWLSMQIVSRGREGKNTKRRVIVFDGNS